MKSILCDEHIDTFCDVMNFDKNEIEKIYINPGRSANNSNYVFVANNESFLYRVPGEGTELFSSREREALAYKLLKPLKLTDEVLYLDPNTGVKISKYYEDSRIPDSDNLDELKESMLLLKKLHKISVDFDYTDTLFDRVDRYRKFAADVEGDNFYLDGYDDYLEKYNCFKNYYSDKGTELCFTHGDASINNVLVTKEYDSPILIDLEFPALADPISDVAEFCIDAEYRKDKILLMLEYYLERKPTIEKEFYLIGLCATCGMMWYAWTAYKCAVTIENQQFIDFRDDYHQYLKEMIAELKKYELYNEVFQGNL